MKFIIELVHLIDEYNISWETIVGNNARKNTKLHRFFLLARSGNVPTDEGAFQNLFPQSNTSATSNYYKLKSRLRSLLVDALFRLSYDQADFTDFQKAYYRCYKDWAAVRMLFGRSAKESAVYLSEKILKQALRYEFVEIIVNLSRVLRLYYATTRGDRKKFEYYSNLLNLYLPVLQAELKAEEFYESLLIEFVNSKATKGDLAERARRYANELSTYADYAHSYSFLFFYYTVSVLQYEIVNEHDQMIAECEKAIQLFEAKPYQLKSQIYGFASKAFSAYLKLGRYEEARRVSATCFRTIEEGTVNWFKFYQVYFILLSHTHRFDEIPAVVTKVLSHPKLEFQSQDTRETWKIYEAYTYILAHADQIPDSPSRQELIDGFRLGRFLNEVPAFSKDKKGANVHLLIIQILILLMKEEFGKIIDRTMALERYSRRYLRKEDEMFRSDCFINMLLKLPEGNFHRVGVCRHAKKYIDKIKQVPLHLAKQPSEFEIIPYEDLWDLVLECCSGYR